MWAIKFLSGPKAGQEILLQKGLVTLGKSSSCQIQILASQISKKHAQITVTDRGVLLEDLDSRNGTFIDGVQIQSRDLKEGDCVALSDVIFELKKKQQLQQAFQPYMMNVYNPYGSTNPKNEESPEQKKLSMEENFATVQKGVKGYIHNVILPGVYKLAEWMELKWVVGVFVLGFIFLVTAFSSIPLMQILKSSLEQESQHHAESIAVTLAKLNRKHLQSGLHTALSVAYAERRPGVKEALIIHAVNGQILSPAEKAHTYPKDSMIHKHRTEPETTVTKVDSSTILAMVPIRFYNPKTGENDPIAYSVVKYNMGALAIGNQKTLSLMIQNFFIACILGLIIFFFLINLIEFPLKSINKQLSKSLKDDKTPAVSVAYRSQILYELCNNINTALNRIALNQTLSEQAENQDSSSIPVMRDNEMSNIVEIVGFPCLSINLEDDSVAAMNSNWNDQVGLETILHSPLEDIEDESLKTELKNLVEQVRLQPQEISFGEIQIKGMQLQTTCQAVMGTTQPAYAIITFMPVEKEVA